MIMDKISALKRTQLFGELEEPELRALAERASSADWRATKFSSSPETKLAAFSSSQAGRCARSAKALTGASR